MSRFCFRRTPPVILLVLISMFSGFFSKPLLGQGTQSIPNDTPALTQEEVTTILTRAVAYLKKRGLAGVICITDREGHVLTLYRMNGTVTDVRINEQAIQKARTSAFFNSDFNSFTTRTAGFIIQKNFPPGINRVDAGPLFGVPFSNFPRGFAGFLANPPFISGDGQTQTPPFIVFVNGISAGTGLFAGLGAIPNAMQNPLGTASSNFRPDDQPLVITPLTDDLGGMAIWKPGPRIVGNGRVRNINSMAGAIGIEIDGFGILQEASRDQGFKRLLDGSTQAIEEERAAFAAQNGFRPTARFRATKVLVNGFRFPYVGKMQGTNLSTAQLAAVDLAADGAFEPVFDTDGSERDPNGNGLPMADQYPATIPLVTLDGTPRATPTQEFPRQGWVGRYPPRDSPLALPADQTITQADVIKLTEQAAKQAFITRAAIRRPEGRPAAVWIVVTDIAGNICGMFRTDDATVFSFDVAIQKARTAAYFSTDDVGISTRGLGFMAQTTYPPGVQTSPGGPMSGTLGRRNRDVKTGLLNDVLANNNPSTDFGTFTLTEISQVLNDNGVSVIDTITALDPGVDLTDPFAILSSTVTNLARRMPHIQDGRLSPFQLCISVDLSLGRPRANGQPALPDTAIPNGITIFPGGVPLYKNGRLVGGLGISGDGVDQDDIIAFEGSRGYVPAPTVRCDNASPSRIIDALKTAIAKAKNEFPNLTNGSDAVLDIIDMRLNKGGNTLQELTIPYVKFPRQPSRKDP